MKTKLPVEQLERDLHIANLDIERYCTAVRETLRRLKILQGITPDDTALAIILEREIDWLEQNFPI